MSKKSVNICIYSWQFTRDIERNMMSISIVIDKIKEGFDEYYKKFKPFLECLKEGNLDYYFRRIKAREKGIDINKIKLDKIEKSISDPKKDKIAYQMLKDMEKTLDLVGDMNFKNMKEFLYKSNLIFIFTEFEKFLFKCIKFALLKYPKILDDKVIKLKEIKSIKSSGNIDLLNEIVAENTIHNLFYQNYHEIFKYLKKPVGLDLEFDQNIINKLNGYKEIRNLVIHGDGTINLLFQSKINNWNLREEDLNLKSLEKGDKILIEDLLLSDLIDLLFDIVIEIDILMVKKFPELRFEIDSLDHLFLQTYIESLREKWKDIKNNI